MERRLAAILAADVVGCAIINHRNIRSQFVAGNLVGTFAGMRDITNPTGEPYEVTRKFLTRREEPKPFDRLGANAD